MNSTAFILLVVMVLTGVCLGAIVLAEESRQVHRDTCTQRGGVVVRTHEGEACIKAEVLK